ncbi:MAG: ribbon-helix-helix protein, CopG family [Thermoanaerobaculia bacterium]|nr:ribbon-helix-helix protein, CopG family [Thermoanaerobaculia bacterium]
MAAQLTIRLSEDLNLALEQMAGQLRRKRAEIVRMALEQFLEQPIRHNRKPSERVGHLLGSLESGIPDLAENHRAYVLETLKNAR